MRIGWLIEHEREHHGVNDAGFHWIFPSCWSLTLWWPKRGRWRAKVFRWEIKCPKIKSCYFG